MSKKDGTTGGRGGGGRERGQYPPKRSPYNNTPGAYVSPVAGIENDTFNTGHSKFASQFKTSRRNVANFVQRSLQNECYLVGKTIKMGEEQTIPLPVAIVTDANGERDLNLLRDAKMAAIGKQMVKLDGGMKKGFAIVYDQCSKTVKSLLKTVDNWTTIECNQYVYDLIKAIQKICVGHNDTN